MDSRIRGVFAAYVTLLLYGIATTVSFMGPVMPLYIASLRIDIIGWSLLVAVQAIGMFVTEWAWGTLSDRTDRRVLMLISILAMSLLSVLFTIGRVIAFFIVLQFVTGVFFVAMGPVTRSYVTEASPQQSMGLYASLWWFFFALGRVIGPILGTFIAQNWSFATAFWATSIISLLSAPFILTLFPSDKGRRQEAPKFSMTAALKQVLGKRSAMLLFFSAAFAFMGRTLTTSYLPLYASLQIKMSTVEVGVLFAAVSAAQLVAMPVVGWFSDKFGRKRTTIIGLAATACLFLLYFWAGTSYQILVLSSAIGVGFCGTSLLLSMIPDVASPATQGTAIGIYGSFEDLGIIGAPLLFGFTWSVFGPTYIFGAAAITQLVGAALVYGINPRHARNG